MEITFTVFLCPKFYYTVFIFYSVPLSDPLSYILDLNYNGFILSLYIKIERELFNIPSVGKM